MDLDRYSFPDSWRAFDRLSRAASGILSPSTSEFPLVNVWMNGDRAIITSELPGVDPKDVEISVAGKSVTLRGSRATEDECEGECQHRRERWSGKFTRSIDLPYAVNQDKVEAKFTKGILELTLPRAEADKPRKIAIKTE
jgi:HSP20 family protein